MGRNPFPGSTANAVFARAALGALTTDAHPPTATQYRLLSALARRFGRGRDATTLEPIGPTEAAEALAPHELDQLAHLVVVLELTEHPLPPAVEAHVEQYLAAAGIDAPSVDLARDTAREQMVALHADFIRQSWTTEETVKQVFHGNLLELARSKLSYYGIGGDRRIAERWEALADCPPGSWGRGVAEFYGAHGFPFPGQPHGIYEVGAKHDWVHVLADYGTSPEGEIDVFAFIAVTMDDPKGFVNFLFTLALFQNASIDTVGGKKVVIARADTLDDDGAADRLADALWRAERCTADPMGAVDVWAHADRPLDELRIKWSIPPKGTPGPGAMDLPG